jgi:hypothetical protein
MRSFKRLNLLQFPQTARHQLYRSFQNPDLISGRAASAQAVSRHGAPRPGCPGQAGTLPTRPFHDRVVAPDLALHRFQRAAAVQRDYRVPACFTFLDNTHLRADGYILEGNCRLYFSRQIRVVELVRRDAPSLQTIDAEKRRRSTAAQYRQLAQRMHQPTQSRTWLRAKHAAFRGSNKAKQLRADPIQYTLGTD